MADLLIRIIRISPSPFNRPSLPLTAQPFDERNVGVRLDQPLESIVGQASRVHARPFELRRLAAERQQLASVADLDQQGAALCAREGTILACLLCRAGSRSRSCKPQEVQARRSAMSSKH
jgi:hypothetical protein